MGISRGDGGSGTRSSIITISDRATLRLYYENKGESENINLNNEDLCDTVNSSSLLEMLASFSASD